MISPGPKYTTLISLNNDITGCSSHGWVLLEDDHEFSLINPITGELKEYCLPSLDSDPTILEFAMNERTKDPLDFDKYLRCNRHHITKMILSTSPSDEGCIVVAEFYLVWELGFCQVGDDSWTILKLSEENVCGRHDMSAFEYKNGLVYAMNDIGQVTLYDLRDLSQKVLTLSEKIMTDNLSYSSSGDLCLVLGKGEFVGVPLAMRRTWGDSREAKFEVYRCVKTRGRHKWRKVKNIGNVVLIVGSIGSETLSLDGIQLNGWEGNHICDYRLKYNRDHSQDHYCHNIIVEMISIENGSVKEIPTSLGLFSSNNTFSWFTPALC
ncbi:hypothetical protein LUZ60_005791 [Juncus effusus]|nr:hypothetical protein LUZ60_005791 [Juncus effusus]